MKIPFNSCLVILQAIFKPYCLCRLPYLPTFCCSVNEIKANKGLSTSSCWKVIREQRNMLQYELTCKIHTNRHRFGIYQMLLFSPFFSVFRYILVITFCPRETCSGQSCRHCKEIVSAFLLEYCFILLRNYNKEDTGNPWSEMG